MSFNWTRNLTVVFGDRLAQIQDGTRSAGGSQPLGGATALGSLDALAHPPPPALRGLFIIAVALDVPYQSCLKTYLLEPAQHLFDTFPASGLNLHRDPIQVKLPKFGRKADGDGHKQSAGSSNAVSPQRHLGIS